MTVRHSSRQMVGPNMAGAKYHILDIAPAWYIDHKPFAGPFRPEGIKTEAATKCNLKSPTVT